MLNGWAPILDRVDLIPSSKGRFEVVLDDELIFSKADLGRHAHDGEVAGILRQLLGPEIERD